MSTVHTAPFSPYDTSVSRPPTCPSPWSGDWMAHQVLRQYNRLRHTLVTSRTKNSNFRELDEIQRYASSLTDIDEHLPLMFIEGLLCKPQLIVELGVRGGASTFVFERVAGYCRSSLISADLDDCSTVSSNPSWHFFRGDDVRFASVFQQFCAERKITPVVDLLFIDTSHYYDHTVQEIASWFPLLSQRAKVIFHDTNLRLIGPRNDGCFALGWDNQRGVIRAIEDFLNVHIDERKKSVTVASGWLVRHWPNCNGLTILDRLP